MRRFGALTSVALAVSLVLLFVAQRILGDGGVRDAFLWIGGLGVLASIAWRVMQFQSAKHAARQAELRLLFAYGGVAVALLLYGASTDAGLELLGLEAESAERADTALGALWPAVLTVSLTTLMFMELAYRKMPLAEAVELRRVVSAAQAGLGISLAIVFLFSINYVTNEKNVKKDFSYFKTTKPSDASRQMVEKLGEPVEAVLFYPEVNEVLEQLKPYFQELDALSDNFRYEVRDHALAPGLARQHRVRKNGTVALLRGEGEEQQAEKFEVGTELEVARSRLRTLDGRFQKAFSRLAQQRREIHLTAGHDERTERGRDYPKEEQTDELRSAFSRSNVETRLLGMAQGLGNEVPQDAPAVAVVGPRKPFMPEEVESLIRYVRQGGRLIVMVDPNMDHGLDPLLRALGLELQPGVLASETKHVRRTYSKADRGNVLTNKYSSHPTVTVASRNSNRVATVVIEGGALGRYKGEEALDDIKVVFPIRTAQDVWRDLDGDWERSKDERLEELNVMAAVEVPREDGEEGRAVVVADGDFVTDQVIRNPGNALVFSDILQWLIGQEQIVGDTSSEEDVRIKHTKEEDQVWFYATSFGVPLPILGVGVWMALRRRRGRRETHRPGDEADTADERSDDSTESSAQDTGDGEADK